MFYLEVILLIVSKFKDYYDTASMYGIDKTIVYVRTNSESEYEYAKRHGRESVGYRSPYTRPSITLEDRWAKIEPYDSIEASVIGFCGKLYPVYRFTLKDEIEVIYDKQEVLDKLREHSILVEDNWRFSDNVKNKNYIDRFFDVNTWKYLESLFVELKQPVFILKNTHSRRTETFLEIAPELKAYKFGKHFSAPLAFQEIQNYISGVIGVGTPDMVQISNEDQIHKKGYDKWSFRTHKEDSKKPRKKK